MPLLAGPAGSGAAIGGIIAFPIIAFLTLHFSWQMVFIIVGAIGLLWLLPWIIIVKAPPSMHSWITDEEREYILTGQRRVKENDDDEEEEEEDEEDEELIILFGSVFSSL